MAADVRSLNAQRDRNQRDADNRLLAEVEAIRTDLTKQSDKRRNAR